MHLKESTTSPIVEQCFRTIANLAVDDRCRKVLGRNGACHAVSVWIRHHYSAILYKSESGYQHQCIDGLDDDELSLNSGITASNQSTSLYGVNLELLFEPVSGELFLDLIISHISSKFYNVNFHFVTFAANLMELACIALYNLCCDCKENKLVFAKLKVHTILNKIIRDNYHQNIHSPLRGADKKNEMVTPSLSYDGLIALMRKTYILVKSSLVIDKRDTTSKHFYA